MEYISILHEPTEKDPFLVLDKPAGLPTAPLVAGEDCALTQALLLFPQLAAVQGRKPIEKGLLHRLDTATRGCVLVAATQQAYVALITVQKNGQFVKQYTALVEKTCSPLPAGFPKLPFAPQELPADFVVESRFRAYGPQQVAVRPVTAFAGPAALKKASPTLYRTQVQLQAGADDAIRAFCTITAGYRHQVRCHLAWCGYPVHGDALYNPRYQAGQKLCFTASAISFPHPLIGERLTFAL